MLTQTLKYSVTSKPGWATIALRDRLETLPVPIRKGRACAAPPTPCIGMHTGRLGASNQTSLPLEIGLDPHISANVSDRAIRQLLRGHSDQRESRTSEKPARQE